MKNNLEKTAPSYEWLFCLEYSNIVFKIILFRIWTIVIYNYWTILYMIVQFQKVPTEADVVDWNIVTVLVSYIKAITCVGMQ